MKVFVTGRTAFIGGHVVRKLRDRGDEVRALARDPGKATGPPGSGLRDPCGVSRGRGRHSRRHGGMRRGEITTMRGLMDTLGQVADRKPPKRTMSTGLLKAMTPIGPVVGKMMGQPPNLRELISTADNVTFWAKHDKAMAELGYSPRGLEEGLRDTLEAEGTLQAGTAA